LVAKGCTGTQAISEEKVGEINSARGAVEVTSQNSESTNR